jgi:hypothetical protein
MATDVEVIVHLSPIGIRHAACVTRVTDLLLARLRGRATLWPQNPLTILPDSEPQPDIILLHYRADFYAADTAGRRRHPRLTRSAKIGSRRAAPPTPPSRPVYGGRLGRFCGARDALLQLPQTFFETADIGGQPGEQLRLAGEGRGLADE